jgi:hypothetical protein
MEAKTSNHQIGPKKETKRIPRIAEPRGPAKGKRCLERETAFTRSWDCGDRRLETYGKVCKRD